MGETNSKEVRASLLKKRSLKEIDDIYSMFDQTIEVVKTSKIMSSNLGHDRLGSSITQSAIRATKISNLDSVLDQLLESFTEKKIYQWGSQIPEQFKHHFRDCFEEIWPINKEEFYLILLRMCRFDTADFQ